MKHVALFSTGFTFYTAGLANALAEHLSVSVVQPRAQAEISSAILDSRVNLVSFEKPKYRRELKNVTAMNSAFSILRSLNTDIVHVQETFDYAYDLLVGFSGLNNILTTIHDVKPHPGDRDAAPGLQYSKAIGIWKSRRLIVHTDEMKSNLSSRFKVPTKKIDVVAHGELGSLYKRVQNSTREDVNGEGSPTLLFFGRIYKYKGLKYLLDALPIVRRELPNTKLHICGRGTDLDANMSLINALGGITVQTGYIDDKEVASIFENADVAVLPYIEASQSGVSAVAFTLGTPVVASRIGGLADQIIDGYNGILVEPRSSDALAQALILILKSSQLRTRISENAKKKALYEMSWPVIANQTLSSYAKIFESN